MTKRPFQKKHLIQVFVGVGVGLLIMAGADLVISLWPGLILVGLGGIIAIAEPRRQTVADWIVRWTGRLPKMSKSLYLVGAGIGIFICTLIFAQDVRVGALLGLILIGSGTIWGLVETIKGGTAHSCGCIALMLFGLMAYILYWFLNAIPNPM
jgi:hypothetical protein